MKVLNERICLPITLVCILELGNKLRYLCKEFGDDLLALFVDIHAICINQKDDNEKGHQIRHMRYIYELASCVRVWLGPEDKDSRKAMDFLVYVNSGDFVLDLASFLNSLREESVNLTLDSIVSLF